MENYYIRFSYAYYTYVIYYLNEESNERAPYVGIWIALILLDEKNVSDEIAFKEVGRDTTNNFLQYANAHCWTKIIN